MPGGPRRHAIFSTFWFRICIFPMTVSWKNNARTVTKCFDMRQMPAALHIEDDIALERNATPGRGTVEDVLPNQDSPLGCMAHE